MWRIMKEVIGKARSTQPLLPCKIIVNNIEINEEKRIANEFNNFFVDISGLRGLKYFLRGSIFYVGHNFYVGCVGQIYFCVGSEFFARVIIFCVGQFFRRASKKHLDWHFHNNILVAH